MKGETIAQLRKGDEQAFERMVNGNEVSLRIENRTFAPYNYLWPFHQTVLRVEPDLKQNPGY
ncbi:MULTISPECIES: hypothetical protein [Olivibacter]|uniref:RagB/SusD domain-containing protein n=1 Tax=Olivibacter jilunii TaxID=985016 RepID=A0ABW6BB32_9SPHI